MNTVDKAFNWSWACNLKSLIKAFFVIWMLHEFYFLAWILCRIKILQIICKKLEFCIFITTFLLTLFLSEYACTVRNLQKFTKFLCYTGNVKFDDIYDIFEQRYLKIAKNVFKFLTIFLILWNLTVFS